MAGLGPIPMMLGSTPAIPYDTKRASGFKLCVLQASSDARTRAAAPSQMPYSVHGGFKEKSFYREKHL